MRQAILVLWILACACVAETTTKTTQSNICEYDAENGVWVGDCNGGGGGDGGGGDGGPPVCYSPAGSCDPQGGWVSDLNCWTFCGYAAHCYPVDLCSTWPYCSLTHEGFCF